MSAGRDITSPAELPARMRAKITEELCRTPNYAD